MKFGQEKQTSGNTIGGRLQGIGMIRRAEGLTVDEIETNDCAVGDSPVVDWFTLPYDRVSQRHKVSDSGARSKVLQIWSNGSILTAGCEGTEFLPG